MFSSTTTTSGSPKHPTSPKMGYRHPDIMMLLQDATLSCNSSSTMTWRYSWLRRRDGSQPAVMNAGHQEDAKHTRDETDLPSSWPATQLESQEPPRSPRRDPVHHQRPPYLSHVPCISEDRRAGSEDYRVRDLPGQGLFGKLLSSAYVQFC